MQSTRSDPATERAAILVWLHIGDLHLTTADAENRRDLDRIVALANALPPGSLDFAVLPGNNPDDGAAEVPGEAALWEARCTAPDGEPVRVRAGVWPEKGIFGTQLGPNRNGRQW